MRKKRGFNNPFEGYVPQISRLDIQKRLLLEQNKILVLEDALNNDEFSREELLVAKLILAQQCYMSGAEQFGDQLILEVVKTKNKGKDVAYYLQDVQMNKSLYLQKSRFENKYQIIKKKSK